MTCFTCQYNAMVGLFKKLGKKKRRDRKGLSNASGDESCTEDESSEKLSYLNSRNFTNESAANGIRSATPNSDCLSKEAGRVSEANSIGRNSIASCIDSHEDQRSVSFDVGNIDRLVDSLDIDDTLSVNSADEGSLFGEDFLSQFQDGQISLQQFLQSPHLSRSEERIRDEEIDSMFSDVRSVESSNFYSDSSSGGSDNTEQRDQELDRIADEYYGAYSEKFTSTTTRYSIQKSFNDSNVNNKSKEFGRNTCRDSYCSLGDETITGSTDNLTVCTDEANTNDERIILLADDSLLQEDSKSPSPKETISGCLTLRSKITVQSNSCSTIQSSLQATQHIDKIAIDAHSVVSNPPSVPPPPYSLAATCNAYTPRRVPVTFPDDLPISPLSFSISPINAPGTPPCDENDDIKNISEYKESNKSLLDRIHERSKSQCSQVNCDDQKQTHQRNDIFDHGYARQDTPTELAVRTLTPTEFLEQRDSLAMKNSRPSSAQSQLSQREVAIVDNTVMSFEGNYIITSNSSRSATPVRNKSPRAEEKVDPWLSYLPQWKATPSAENSPARCVSSVSDGGLHVNKRRAFAEEIIRPASTVPPKLQPHPADIDNDRYIRFSGLDIDFFIPPPPVEEDTISTAQEILPEAIPFHLEWDYEIGDSPTLTPSSSVIYLGNREKASQELDSIAESLLGLLPIQSDKFETSVTAALGELITEIVSTRQKFSKMARVLEFQDFQLKEHKQLILAQAKELIELKSTVKSKTPVKSPLSPRSTRRNEFKSYPASGRRSKELVDLEDTLDKLLFQCHTLQKNSNTDADVQVFQPIDRAEVVSRAGSYFSDDGSIVEVKTLLHKRIPDSPANHVQIVPAKGVVFKSCKETKEDVNAIQK